MTSSSGGSESRGVAGQLGNLVILLVGAAAIIVFMSVEILEDGTSATAVGSGLLESAMVVAPVVVACLLYREVRHSRREQQLLMEEVRRTRADGAAWRTEKRELLRGLGEAIDEQFRTWGLTDAEREVGLLMLKGLNHREIARYRGTSERTVRQQARAIYAKSNLSGRTALSAYFLEDLLLPVNQRG